MAEHVIPKSDQLNADDLIGAPRTISIAKVIGTGNGDQPVAVHFDGDEGRPYKPCKSMRRVMIAVWGADAAQYPGRSMTLYRDPEVAFGGMKVGGIRISHMSHLDREMTMALTATRASRKPYTVKPLRGEAAPKQQEQRAEVPKWRRAADALLAKLEAVTSAQELLAITDAADTRKVRDFLKEHQPEVSNGIEAAIAASYQKHVSPPADQPADIEE